MKRLIIAITALLLLVGCTARQGNSPENSSKPAEPAAEPPVELTSLGLTPDRKNIAFKIMATGDKPVIQVDLAIKEMNKNGKVLLETTLLWQRKECCPRAPLEKGVIYEAEESIVEPGTARAEGTVQRVHFQDGSTWAPK